MKLGVFDHMDRGLESLDRFYEERLKLVEAYDRAGFYGYHVAEHHATPLGVAPSPGVWLAAVAQRTKHLRFGPLVYLLPLYHPIKLLEEICMLDQISGGRLLLGVGRGISPIELRYYGLDPDQTPAMYAEGLEVILRGMTNPVLNFDGKYYNFRNVPMEMTPFQTPHPPLWYGLGRAEAVPWAARNRVNIVGNLPGAGMRALTDRYRAEWDALGQRSGRSAADGRWPSCGGRANREGSTGNRPPWLRQMARQLSEIMDRARHDAGRARDLPRDVSRMPRRKAARSRAHRIKCAISCSRRWTMPA